MSAGARILMRSGNAWMRRHKTALHLLAILVGVTTAAIAYLIDSSGRNTAGDERAGVALLVTVPLWVLAVRYWRKARTPKPPSEVNAPGPADHCRSS